MSGKGRMEKREDSSNREVERKGHEVTTKETREEEEEEKQKDRHE